MPPEAIEGEVIETAVTAIEPYSEIRAQLLELKQKNEAAVFDYADPKGEKLARSHIHGLRTVKGSIERQRKDLKAEALKWGRRVDAGAKELTAEIEAMIEVHQKPLDEIAEREAARVAAIDEAINAITEPGEGLTLVREPTADHIAEVLESVTAIEITAEVYQERMAEATTLRNAELHRIGELLKAQQTREAERAELERLRKEAEEKARQEREAELIKQAADNARRKAEEQAERERVAAEAKAKAEREAAENIAREEREAAARREAELKAEADRLKREAAEAEERARVKAQREAEAERAAEAKREADRKHAAKVKGEAAKALQSIDGIDAKIAASVIDMIAAHDVPHVSIRF